ncbi:hypothetical protein P154DRAFT_528187 [Amniculicola lignicola CBS 123094]|uniref:Mid2 domain-containing protein n=1 Tax=Amniculicola lignicola CBS 123094 TaxID=1392246 RepID=A0A6A5W5F4_9PLEO|nr:hypothetical protein P154DRAFT_528187 [Amniculicola lignicola CBS 123094]
MRFLRPDTPSSSSILLSSLLLASLEFIRPTLAATSCYRPDGSLESNAQFQPCASDLSNPLSNLCCATTGRLSPGSQGTTNDECMPNGLCMNRSKNSEGQVVIKYARGDCTENDWSKGLCNPVCGTSMGYAGATPCDGTANSTRWCCGKSTDCCIPENNLPVYTLAANWGDPVPTGLAISSSSASTSAPASATKANQVPIETQTSSAFKTVYESTSISTSTSTSTSTATPKSQNPANETTSPTASANPQPNTSLSTGAKAGIAIGATLGALILIGLGIFIQKFSKWGRNHRANKTSPEKDLGEDGLKTTGYYAHYNTTAPAVYAEMDGNPEPREMMDEYGVREVKARMWEVPGDGVREIPEPVQDLGRGQLEEAHTPRLRDQEVFTEPYRAARI